MRVPSSSKKKFHMPYQTAFFPVHPCEIMFSNDRIIEDCVEQGSQHEGTVSPGSRSDYAKDSRPASGGNTSLKCRHQLKATGAKASGVSNGRAQNP